MAEYICREAVVRYLKGYSEKECNSNSPYGMITSSVLNKAERALSEMPAADVQPVKKGHWYHNTSKYISELDAYFIQACCSCCGKYSDRVDLYATIMSNEMCSHCGAKMDGGTNG